MSKKKKIILHGHLAELYPHPIEVEADTVAEAVRSLEQLEELKSPSGEPHPVVIKDVNSEIALFSVTEMEEIHVYPQSGGAKQGGLLQVLVGITLIAVGFVFPAISLAGGLITQSALYLTGGMMLLGGVLQMLVPMPEVSGPDDQENSRYLGASQNTVRIGTHIPLAYGNVKIGGQYLSFDVDAKDQATEGEQTGSNYQSIDSSGIVGVPVMPVFTADIADPLNIPTSGWIQ